MKKKQAAKIGSRLMGIGGALGIWLSPLLSGVMAVRAQGAGKWTGRCVGGAQGDVATIQGVVCLVANGMSVVFSLLGLGGFIMLIVAGVRYMTSGGNSQGAEKAKKSISGIIIGLALVLCSWLIVSLISNFTGLSLAQLWFAPDTP